MIHWFTKRGRKGALLFGVPVMVSVFVMLHAVVSTRSAETDSDNDGMSNYAEYIADTNPTNGSSRLSIQSLSGGTNRAVFFRSSANRKYTLYYSTNLIAGAWTNVPSQTGVSGSGGVDVFTDSLPAAASCFYRIGVSLP